MSKSEKPQLLRITFPDCEHLLLTTEEDIAKTREEKRTHVELRDDEGRIVGIHVQTLGNSSKCMSYEARYGTGLISLRNLLFTERKPWDGTYVKVLKQTINAARRDRNKVPRSYVDSDGTNAACNGFFERRGDVNIVFGQLA